MEVFATIRFNSLIFRSEVFENKKHENLDLVSFILKETFLSRTFQQESGDYRRVACEKSWEIPRDCKRISEGDLNRIPRIDATSEKKKLIRGPPKETEKNVEDRLPTEMIGKESHNIKHVLVIHRNLGRKSSEGIRFLDPREKSINNKQTI